MIIKLCLTLVILHYFAISSGFELTKLAVLYSGAKNNNFESNLQCSVNFINNLNILNHNWQLTIDVTNVNTAEDSAGVELYKAGQNLYKNGKIICIIGPEISGNIQELHRYAVGINIPHISPITSDSILRDKKKFPMLVRMTKENSYKINAVLDFVQSQGWKSIGILISDDLYFQYLTIDVIVAAEKKGIKLQLQRTIHEISPGIVSAKEEILSFKRAGQHVILILCPSHQIHSILLEAENCGLNEQGWAFVIWEDISLIENSLSINSFSGLIGTKLKVEEGSLYQQLINSCAKIEKDAYTLQYVDSLLAFSYGLRLLLNKLSGNLNLPAGDTENWVHGQELLENILLGTPQGVTNNNLTFNVSEQVTMTTPSYDVVNLHDDRWKKIGTWSNSQNPFLTLNNEKIKFMGGAKNISSYVRELKYQNLRAITIESPPFVFVNYSTNEQGENTTIFSGYAIDLFEEISKQVGFSFSFKVELLRSGLFGGRDPISGQWDGVVGEVVAGRADIALAPLTITQQRLESVDFAEQYYKTDLKYAVNENSAHGVLSGYDRYAFILPFTPRLWLVIISTVVILAVFFTIVSRLSPYGGGNYFQSSEAEEAHVRLERRKNSVMSFVGSTTNVFGKRRMSDVKVFRRKSSITGTREVQPGIVPTNSSNNEIVDNNDPIDDIDEEAIDDDEHQRNEAERQMSFSNAMYFAFAGLLWQSPESVPHAPSARIAAAVWYMVGVILVASYTANMVSFVTETSEKTRLLTVRELLLQDNVVPATVRSTSVNSLLRAATLPLAEKLYEAMLNHPEQSFLESEPIARQKMTEGDIAFIWDGAMLDYAAKLSNCELTTVPLGFGEAFYAYALPFGSTFTAEFSAEIKKLQENGFIASLEAKYFPKSEICMRKPEAETAGDNLSYVPLTYYSLAGVFDMVLMMAALSLIVLLFEWICASFGDVDRSNPYKPSSFGSAFYTRWQRLVNDAFENWILYKKLKRIFRKRFGKVGPKQSLQTGNPKSIRSDQWTRYTSSESASELKRGQSISDPEIQKSSILALSQFME